MPLSPIPAFRQWIFPFEVTPSKNKHKTKTGLCALSSMYGVSLGWGLPSSWFLLYSSIALRITSLKPRGPASRRAISQNFLTASVFSSGTLKLRTSLIVVSVFNSLFRPSCSRIAEIDEKAKSVQHTTNGMVNNYS